MSFRLDGRHALITGASRGIGAAIALAFAAAGAAKLTLIARDRQALDGIAAAARGHGAAVDAATCDVTDVSAFGDALSGREPFDVLVCAAGANVPQPVSELDLATADMLWALNVRAGLQAVRDSAPHMPAGGAIVFISSQMGHVGEPGRSVYCATKHAVEGMTRALAVELAPRGLRVVAIAPTFVATAMTAAWLADETVRSVWLARIPLGRLATVEEVAAAALFAASPAAGSLTGTSLVVDGGWTAR